MREPRASTRDGAGSELGAIVFDHRDQQARTKDLAHPWRYERPAGMRRASAHAPGSAGALQTFRPHARAVDHCEDVWTWMAWAVGDDVRRARYGQLARVGDATGLAAQGHLTDG